MEGVLTWMEGSALAHAILEHAWVFPTLEILHFLGLILLIGSLYVIDLRFIGVAPRIPYKAVLPFIPISVLGFGINLVTGILFLFTDPPHYYSNLAFRLKMMVVVLAGLNALWFRFAVDEVLTADGDVAVPPPIVKWIAGLSMLLWTSVIVLGRLIPYL
jgi:hypothetical protein